MQWRHWVRALAVMGVVLVAAVSGTAVGGTASSSVGSWERWLHVRGILDLAGPRSDGRLVAAAHGRLDLVSVAGKVTRFAPGYSVPAGPESYIALSPGVAVDGTGCSFARDEVLALDLTRSPPGITRISAAGRVSHLATVTGVSTLSGITLDTVGGFGHRLVVIGPVGPDKTQVSAVNCRGVVSPIGTVDARLEGGIAAAPRGFGAFGEQLVAASEGSGSIYAVSPEGAIEHGRSLWGSLGRRHRGGKRWIRSRHGRERRLPGRPGHTTERQTPSRHRQHLASQRDRIVCGANRSG